MDLPWGGLPGGAGGCGGGVHSTRVYLWGEVDRPKEIRGFNGKAPCKSNEKGCLQKKKKRMQLSRSLTPNKKKQKGGMRR